VLLIEEHALVRAGLRSLIDTIPGLTVVAEAEDVGEALTLAYARPPDALVLSASALVCAGDEARSTLRGEFPQAGIFVLGDGDVVDENSSEWYLHLPRNAGIPEFCAAVGTLLGDRDDACRFSEICPVARAVAALSRRERQVAVRIADGLTSKQIASALGLAIRTVNTYRENLARKLGASSAAVLTRYVIEFGLRDTGAANGE
jgi:DNA-binding NarL/FixJ family response regulator